MVDTAKAGATPIIIKKYANRRLYNTNVSSYITLGDLAQMTRAGVGFQVLDAKTGADITHTILTQIIMEAEANGTPMLPVRFLCQLITLYQTPLQSRVPGYLAHSMDSFMATSANADAHDDAIPVFDRGPAIEARPATGHHRGHTPSAMNPQQAVNSAITNDLALLRDQMSAMQQRLDALVN